MVPEAFAPSVIEEAVSDWFQIDRPSPYMLLTADVRPEHRLPEPDGADGLWGIEKLKVVRSKIPAITHVDYSARLQTVSRRDNPRSFGPGPVGFATLVASTQ